MYAVIETGGKQYRVSPGDLVKVEKLEVEPGKEVCFDQVLMVSGEQTFVGTPLVENARVIGEVVEQGKGEKIIILKYKPRKHSQKKRGHRQRFTSVRIKQILLGDQPLKDAEKTES